MPRSSMLISSDSSSESATDEFDGPHSLQAKPTEPKPRPKSQQGSGTPTTPKTPKPISSSSSPAFRAGERSFQPPSRTAPDFSASLIGPAAAYQKHASLLSDSPCKPRPWTHRGGDVLAASESQLDSDSELPDMHAAMSSPASRPSPIKPSSIDLCQGGPEDVFDFQTSAQPRPQTPIATTPAPSSAFNRAKKLSQIVSDDAEDDGSESGIFKRAKSVATRSFYGNDSGQKEAFSVQVSSFEQRPMFHCQLAEIRLPQLTIYKLEADSSKLARYLMTDELLELALQPLTMITWLYFWRDRIVVKFHILTSKIDTAAVSEPGRGSEELLALAIPLTNIAAIRFCLSKEWPYVWLTLRELDPCLEKLGIVSEDKGRILFRLLDEDAMPQIRKSCVTLEIAHEAWDELTFTTHYLSPQEPPPPPPPPPSPSPLLPSQLHKAAPISRQGSLRPAPTRTYNLRTSKHGQPAYNPSSYLSSSSSSDVTSIDFFSCDTLQVRDTTVQVN